MMRLLRIGVGLLLLAQISLANAELSIEIVGAGEYQIPVSIVPFGGDEKLGQSIQKIIVNDLRRTGLFRIVNNAGRTPHQPDQIHYPDWQSRGVEALAIGMVESQSNGLIKVRFRLLDVVKEFQLTGQIVSSNEGEIRAISHHIADLIYEKLTGDKGTFSTQIAYVNRVGKRFTLIVADSDGYNEQNVLTQHEPIMSPAWSPDGSRIAYVSFETGRAAVYVQSLYTTQRVLLANFRGSNSAPAWSPDGKRLAIVLTRDGGSQIYLVRPDGSGLRRLTFSGVIDTSPNFSPDGKFILFTSDRGGRPQVYRMSVDGGPALRLTFGGGSNFSPRHSPDGKRFVFAHLENGGFRIATQSFLTGQMEMLTDAGWGKKPSYAPNGKLILFASEARGRGILATVSSDGRIKQNMFPQKGDAREPVWGSNFPIQ